MVELVRAGRTPEELSKEFEPLSEASISISKTIGITVTGISMLTVPATVGVRIHRSRYLDLSDPHSRRLFRLCVLKGSSSTGC